MIKHSEEFKREAVRIASDAFRVRLYAFLVTFQGCTSAMADLLALLLKRTKAPIWRPGLFVKSLIYMGYVGCGSRI
jgi:hypothetical protein